MAASLNKPLAIMLLTSCLTAQAEEVLNDPTRPAFELLPASGDGEVLPQVATPKGLQSVILSGGQDAAIIDGKKIEVGQQYEGAVLTVVNETCVVLNGPAGRRVLHLYPGVSMSSTEAACEGRRGVPVISKAPAQRKVNKTVPKKKKAVTGVNGETSDGSGK